MLSQMWVVIFFPLFLTSCLDLDAALRKAKDILHRGPGEVAQQSSNQNKENVSESPHQVDAETAAALAKANQERLFEMLSVIYDNSEIEDKSNFGQLANSLNQGASLEGIYRGIILGPRYQGLEGQSKAASPLALKVFAVELSEIQVDMMSPTQFTLQDKRPLAIEFPDENDANKVHTNPMEQSTPEEKLSKGQIASAILKNFVGASVFTLKRILGDEAMKRFDELQKSKNPKQELANFYATMTVRVNKLTINGKPIDFGLEQRNLTDFDFHFRWAENMAVDRIKWEALNRYHRTLNAFAKAE